MTQAENETLDPYDDKKQVTLVFLVLQRLRLRNTPIPPGAREGRPGDEGVKSRWSGAKLFGFKFRLCHFCGKVYKLFNLSGPQDSQL